MKYLMKIIAAETIGALEANDEIEGRVLSEAISESPKRLQVTRVWAGKPNEGVASTKELAVTDFRAVRMISDEQFGVPVAIIYMAWVKTL